MKNEEYYYIKVKKIFIQKTVATQHGRGHTDSQWMSVRIISFNVIRDFWLLGNIGYFCSEFHKKESD